MTRTLIKLSLAAVMVASAHADTALTIGKAHLIGLGGPCWDDTIPDFSTMSSTFALSGVSGNGTLTSSSVTVANNGGINPGYYSFYRYSLNLSGMSSGGPHCISVLIHFGTPVHCVYDVLVLTNGVASQDVFGASLAAYGDIRIGFSFNINSGSCLFPGDTATQFGMLSDTQPKTNYITIIDRDFSGNVISSVNVPAIVPDVPPNWVYVPPRIPFSTFQGSFICNAVPFQPGLGAYDLRFKLLNAASNGLSVSPTVTQTVQMVNGLFTMPLPFDPNVFTANPRWLSLSARPSGNGTFTALNPPLALTPAPQALYAYSAGVVADIGPGQAVISLDGLTGAVQLQPGSGIFLATNGNTLTISTAIGSDRNSKKDFSPVDARTVLDQLLALPLQRWRYLNEDDRTRHLGPMAQDFKATFGLGSDDKTIGLVDAAGVSLAAIQGLNEKLETRSEKLEAENAELKSRLERLEKFINEKNGGAK